MSPRAAALVAGMFSAAWVATRAASFLSLPSGYIAYLPGDAFDAQLIEPVLHAPWLGTVSWVFAALLAFGLVASLWLLAGLWGASRLATLAAVAALLVAAPWVDTVRHGGPLAIALVFTWLAWLFVLASRAGGVLRPLAGIACWVAALTASWLALVSAPILIAGLTVGQRRRRVRLVLVVCCVAAAVLGLTLYAVRTLGVTTALNAYERPALSIVDVVTAIVDHVVRPDETRRPSLDAVSIVVVTFAAIGVISARLRKRWRVSVVVSGAVVAGVAMVWPLWAGAAMAFGVWLAAPFVAVGVTAVAGIVAAPWRVPATLAMGALLCGVSGWGPSATRLPTTQTALGAGPLAPLLGSLAIDGALWIAEGRDVDAAVIAAHGAAAAWRLPRDAAYTADAVEHGRTVLAGPMGRRQLELTGFRFQRLTSGAGEDGFGVSRVTGQLHCAIVRSDRWSQLPGLEYTGRLGVEIPASIGGSLILIVGDDARPRLAATDVRGSERPVTIDPLLTAPSVDAPPPDYWFDGGDPARAPGQVFRVTMAGRPGVAELLDVSLGRRAPRVIARLRNMDSSARGRVCAAPLATQELWSDPRTPAEAVVPLTRPSTWTTGWYGLEGGPDGALYRWTDGVAVTLVASARRTPVRIALDAEPAAEQGSDPPLLTLRVNGVEQPARPMPAGPSRYEWAVSPRTWLAGTNELLLRVSRVRRPADRGGRDTRVLGMKVTRLSITRVEE